MFDSDTHSWKERGRGELHLNDSLQSSPSEIPQSRIGVRDTCVHMCVCVRGAVEQRQRVGGPTLTMECEK